MYHGKSYPRSESGASVRFLVLNRDRPRLEMCEAHEHLPELGVCEPKEDLWLLSADAGEIDVGVKPSNFAWRARRSHRYHDE